MRIKGVTRSVTSLKSFFTGKVLLTKKRLKAII